MKGEMCNCKCFCQIVLSHRNATCGFCLSLSLLMKQGSFSLDSIYEILLLLLLQKEMQEFSVQLLGFVVKVMMLLAACCMLPAACELFFLWLLLRFRYSFVFPTYLFTG